MGRGTPEAQGWDPFSSSISFTTTPFVGVFCNIHSNIFTDMARDIKERINTWDFIRPKASAWLKKTALNYKENQQYGKTYLPMIPQTRA